MDKLLTTFEITDKTATGGRIVISTPVIDRDKDRVFPGGANFDSYLKNPVVLWGHNKQDPWAVIGKTTRLEVSADGITADFELREPASDTDPQHVVKMLWDGGWVRTASIGFVPNMAAAKANGLGGFDIPDWELLEWSIVPIPANQEAIRLAAKSFDWPAKEAAPVIVADEPAPEIEEAAYFDEPEARQEHRRRRERPHAQAVDEQPIDEGGDDIPPAFAEALQNFIQTIKPLLGRI